MRAELPWNVAGIPPEAREAARAAARREGLSVGEWLTRRILRSFSDLGVERDSMSTPDRTNLDAWGLPQSTASRRDTEEMLARVSRSESESGDAYRRIEEQLRGVARRLDSSERSQSESNRVLSKTAAEMNIAAREQTQAFDQLGQSVIAINERLEALERARAQDGLKDAVKGLHQGLTRLADQVGTTANQSASQISMVAGNLDQVAARLAEVRADSENSAQTLDQRLSTVERLAHSGADAIDHAVERLEQRLGIIEKSTGDIIGRGLERLEQRLGLVEKTAGETVAPSLERLEQRLGNVERHAGEIVAPGLEKLEHRLGQVEHAAGEIAGAGLEKLEQRLGMVEKTAGEPPAALDHIEQRLGMVEKSAQVATGAIDHALDKLDSHANDRAGDRAEFERHAGHMQDALARLEEWMGRLEQRAAGSPDHATGGRLDNIERALTELVEQLDQGHPVKAVEEGLQALAGRIEALEKNQAAAVRDAPPAATQPAAAPQAPEPAPAFPADEAPAHADALSQDAHPFTPAPDPHGFGPPQFSEPSFAAANEAPPFAESPHDFAEPQGGFADLGLTPGPDFSGHFEEPFSHPDLTSLDSESGAPENFLSAARRSAREASERAEAEKRGRLGGFTWGTPANDGGEKSHSRYLALGAFGAVLVLVLAAGLVLSQRQQPADVAATFPAAKPPAPAVPALTIAKPAMPPAALPHPPSAQEPVRLSPNKPVTQAKANPPTLAATLPGKPAQAITVDRATQLANAGNATAETIIGLRYLDGTGGTPANSAQAAKWLGQAANKGQAVAQYRFGTLLERGQGVAADPVRATRLYLAAANQGNRKAMHNLAVAFAEGVGGRKDMAEAARWFARAAGLGLSDSQFNLAVLYERGDGVPQSLLDAYKWYAIAAAQGDAESRQRLSVLQTQLGDADRAAAQRAAANFHAVALNRATNVPPEMGDLGN